MRERATFYLDITEVTVAAYRACVQAGRCSLPNTYEATSRPSCNYDRPGAEEHPINCLDLDQAKVYCTWRGGRLPTEAEWEYAARGTRRSKYPWGNEVPDQQLCWKRRTIVPCTESPCTCAVGSFAKTLLGQGDPFGVADLAGNVWEWTDTQYCAPYGQNCTTKYVLRGGSWYRDVATDVRAAFRYRNTAAYRDDSFGFRCSRTGIPACFVSLGAAASF